MSFIFKFKKFFLVASILLGSLFYFSQKQVAPRDTRARFYEKKQPIQKWKDLSRKVASKRKRRSGEPTRSFPEERQRSFDLSAQEEAERKEMEQLARDEEIRFKELEAKNKKRMLNERLAKKTLSKSQGQVRSFIQKKSEKKANKKKPQETKASKQDFIISSGSAKTINATDDETNKTPTSSTLNLAPVLTTNKTSATVKEEENTTITLTGKDPENIFVDFSIIDLPSFVTATRTGDKLELDINPLYGDNGSYIFKVIVTDDQGLTDSLNLALNITKYVHTITKLRLIKSDTNVVIGDLTDGQTIDLDIVGDKLNIIALAPFAGSVKFESSDLFTRVENSAAFAYRGKVGSNFNDWTPTVGPLTIVVTPFELDNEGGASGTPYTINLNFIDSNP